MRRIFVSSVVLVCLLLAVLTYFSRPFALMYIPVVPLALIGFYDMVQTRHTIRRNFPVVGHGRYLLEKIRPEINQYFIESNTDGMPFSREDRSVVYQRAKSQLDTVPFGTQRNLYLPGTEWMNHSLRPVEITEEPRVVVGAGSAEQPYSLSLLNVGAMSFGALGHTAVRSLNLGAKEARFAHNTGEGGISDHHLMGGDLIWQIGAGYFGCRTSDGRFDPDKFAETAAHPAVKMIELKLSQGAKPGHGGILPGKKVTPEIARIRGLTPGRDVISPPAHSAFDTPLGLIQFINQLRSLSGGKPVGFKLCIGKRREFLAIMKAMVQTHMHPDFIAVDGAEGGTGAAPLEFANTLGHPLIEGLIFAQNALVGVGFRSKVRLIASGKIVTGFDLARALALGADACYSARAMMMAIGCIQARRCNANDCPAGVATQKPSLTVGLVVEEKTPRVVRYHRETVESFLELLGASGLDHPSKLRPWHIARRLSFEETKHYGQLFEYIEPGSLLRNRVPQDFERAWNLADPRTFESNSELASRELMSVL